MWTAKTTPFRKCYCLLIELAYTAADRVYLAIVNGDTGEAGEPRLKPI